LPARKKRTSPGGEKRARGRGRKKMGAPRGRGKKGRVVELQREDPRPKHAQGTKVVERVRASSNKKKKRGGGSRMKPASIHFRS